MVSVVVVILWVQCVLSHADADRDGDGRKKEEGNGMTEEDIKKINKITRMMYSGAIADRFDVAIEQLSRIAVDDRISEPIHKTLNPMLDDMIRQLHIMRNNAMACMIGKDDTPMKVAQPARTYSCDDCANKDSDICDRCQACPEESPMIPSKWRPLDCDEGRICPICGKVMILGEDEKTYYQKWECDGCGYKEDD